MNGWPSGDVSLNVPIRADSDNGWTGWLTRELARRLSLPRATSSTTAAKALASALSLLNDRERRIFEARRLAEEPIALAELADEFGVSRERQIDANSFEKVQKALKSRIAAIETPASAPVHVL